MLVSESFFKMKGRKRNFHDISRIQSAMFRDGLLYPIPQRELDRFSMGEKLYFMAYHGVYCIPTVELIQWMRENIVGTAIEIAAGLGILGRALDIPMTDSKQRDDLKCLIQYGDTGIENIRYPSDIEKLSGAEAVEKYRPDTVVGTFVMHKWRPGMEDGNEAGVDMEDMIKRVKRLILVGNIDVHKENPLLRGKYRSFPMSWLFTRATDQSKNRIYLFENSAL